MKKIIGGLIVLLSYNIDYGQAGSLDPSFGNLIVRDQVGRVIERVRIIPNQIVVLGKSYQPGIYFAEVSQGGKRFTTKLIKQ